MADLIYIYRKSGDGGKELRYSLRSLANLKGDKEVYLIGDSERWVKNVTHIQASIRANTPYVDVWGKLMLALHDKKIPDEFWVWQDDIYITRPIVLKTLYDGELPENGVGMHKRSLQRTRELLLSQNKNILNYDIHVPFFVTKKRLREIAPTIQSTMRGVPVQWRSYYGNTFNIGGEQYEDKKTKTSELKQGDIISTQFFTEELAKLFPEPSQYEKDKGVTS